AGRDRTGGVAEDARIRHRGLKVVILCEEVRIVAELMIDANVERMRVELERNGRGQKITVQSAKIREREERKNVLGDGADAVRRDDVSREGVAVDLSIRQDARRRRVVNDRAG